jgi:hypothetical protein
MLSRETDHNRVPAPPHMITGISRRLPIARYSCLLPRFLAHNRAVVKAEVAVQAVAGCCAGAFGLR